MGQMPSRTPTMLLRRRQCALGDANIWRYLIETPPDGVTFIGKLLCNDARHNSNAFAGCTSLRSITLPDNRTVIGDYAFSDCSHLGRFGRFGLQRQVSRAYINAG